MGNCLEAAGKAKLKFFVLDRVNPINGTSSKVRFTTGNRNSAFHSVSRSARHDVGELARM